MFKWEKNFGEIFLREGKRQLGKDNLRLQKNKKIKFKIYNYYYINYILLLYNFPIKKKKIKFTFIKKIT